MTTSGIQRFKHEDDEGGDETRAQAPVTIGREATTAGEVFVSRYTGHVRAHVRGFAEGKGWRRI